MEPASVRLAMIVLLSWTSVAETGNMSLMGLLDRLFGRPSEPDAPARTAPAGPQQQPEQLTDEQALERYRYLVRTAPPDRIEQAHEEAFAAMTPDQRRKALEDLSAEVPEQERATSDDPRSLARMATRAELNRPGTVERAFGGGGMLAGAGGMLLTSFMAAFVGSTIATALWQDYSDGTDGEGGEGDQGSDADTGADSADAGSDFGGGDFGGGDVGGF